MQHYHLYTHRKQHNPVVEFFASKMKKRTLLINTKELKRLVDYGFLYKNHQNQWRILDKNNVELIPIGKYIFVKMASGFIRVQPLGTSIKHVGLAGYAEKVRYAGEVVFAADGSGEMLEWNNKSGGYEPKATLRFLTRLPEALFKPYDEDVENLQTMGASSSASGTVEEFSIKDASKENIAGEQQYVKKEEFKFPEKPLPKLDLAPMIF